MPGWVVAALLVGLPACGPSTQPGVECGTEDVQAEAEVVIGVGGPSCKRCSIDADLVIATTLRTECGPVEWRTTSTCLAGPVSATRAGDGKVYTMAPRYCGSSLRSWSVAPGEPIVEHEIRVADVFDVSPTPGGTYTFEVEFPANLGIDPALFDVTLE